VAHLRGNPGAGKDLVARAAGFRERLRGAGFDCGPSASQIIPLVVGGNERVVGLSRFLRERGIKAPAIRSPAVPRGTERVRFSLHAGFTAAQEEEVLSALKEWRKGS